MKMPLSAYAKIGLYAIKNHKVSEFFNLKLQKDANKKKSKPEINSEDREFLKRMYKEDVIKTEKILNRSLHWDLT